MSDKTNGMVEPKKSKIALVMAAMLAMFQNIKGTKPRVIGWNPDGSMKFRTGTFRGFGMFGRSRSIGGTPEYNQAWQATPEPLRKPRRGWPCKRKEAVK